MVIDHDRRRAFGGDQQELPTPVPRPFLDEPGLDSHFAEDEADETGVRTKGMVIERDHWEPSEWPREPRAGDSAARRRASNAAGQVNSGLTAGRLECARLTTPTFRHVEIRRRPTAPNSVLRRLGAWRALASSRRTEDLG